jgi:TPR repeat protein
MLALLLALPPLAAAGAGAAPASSAIEVARAAVRTLQYQRALDTLRAPAAAGDTGAQYLLALLYLNGVGVEADAARALSLLQSAAERGHAAAAYVLAGELTRGAVADAAAATMAAPIRRATRARRMRCASMPTAGA